MPKLFSTLINAHIDTTNHGLLHNYIGPRAVANGLKGLKTRCWRICSFSISTEYTRAVMGKLF